MRFARWAGALAVLTLGGGGWLAVGQPGTLPATMEAAAQATSTTLEIEFVGGFAFVQSSPRLDVAYLKDASIKLSDTRPLTTGESDKIVCTVDQMGTEMKIVRGTIISSLPPAAPGLLKKKFTLDGKTVTFPALELLTVPVSAVHTWPPTPPLPTPPGDASQWLDLRFVPGLKKFHGGTNNNWEEKIDGRIRLKGGAITGGVPSNPFMQSSHFDFKEVPGASKFPGAVTDRTVYTVTVPGSSIVMEFKGPGPLQRLEIAPLGPGKPVRLRVRGLHTTKAMPAPGAKLSDFCAFYALFDDIPDHETWLEPHLIMTGAPTFSTGLQPSPGFFCPMDWF